MYAGAGVLICLKCRENKQSAVQELLAGMQRVEYQRVTQTRYGVIAFTPKEDHPETMLSWIRAQRPTQQHQRHERPTRGR